jgi:Fe-Mn family superoxide dismutase
MAPEGETGMVSAALLTAIESTFGSMADFQDTFSKAAGSQFGSGWAWLVVRSDGSLVVTNTPNQDNPLMLGLVPEEEYGTPILGVDVWEHAYYLKYQNRRGDYVQNWWNVVNWDQVSANYAEAVAG